jgi:hypothetical protein
MQADGAAPDPRNVFHHSFRAGQIQPSTIFGYVVYQLKTTVGMDCLYRYSWRAIIEFWRKNRFPNCVNILVSDTDSAFTVSLVDK